ncbi:MAG TPA: T9SS type A sorting domain-containing protein [Cyclobacteriaceae bacterium]
MKFLQGTTTKNFYEIQKSVGPALKKKYGRTLKPAVALRKRLREESREEEEEKENAYLHYKRWENFMEPRVYPSGDITLPSSTYERYMEYVQRTPELQSMYYNSARMAEATADTSWHFVGPPGSNMQGRNAGRMNFIRIDPSNTNIVYAGSPGGGLWKSVNGGVEWRTNTDYLSIIGCSDLAIDPSNTNILYLATGDFDGGDTRSIGVLKSTDAGLTWNETGLAWDVSSSPKISRVLVNPENTQIIIVAASDGIYRSTDGGTSWEKTLSSEVLYDAEFKPGDASILYATGNNFYRSADGGVTWTTITSALPTTNIGRTSLAVTPANSDYVYVLYSNNDKNDFLGFYRSTDSGLNFALRANSPNILGYNLDAGSGGQSWYDQGLTVSSVDADAIISSGVRACRSTDGGTTWVVATSDCDDTNLEMHWDIHYVEFVPGSSTNAFAACDGGIYKTVNAGTCWSAINQDNVSVQQIYKFSMSSTNPDIMISGHQDGATIIHNVGTYSQVLGGDGMDCFIDRANSNVMYGSVYFGAYNRSVNGGVTFTGIVTGLTGQAAWVAPWQQDPIDAATLWAGYSQVFRSTNRGTNWTQMGTIPNDGTMVDIHVAPSDNKVVYACRYNELFVTTTAGTVWKDITAGLPVDIAAMTGLSVDDADPKHVWVTFSGYTENLKIFESTDGGTTWNNYSAGLPNLPANCIRIVPGTGSKLDELYAGCDVGVYYRNNTMSSWTPYFKDLAHARVTDIEIYKPTSKIRVSTYGRGIWEAPLKYPVVVVTGIEKENVGTFYCYPNPFVKEVVIKGKGKFSYTIYNEAGAVVGKGDAEETVKVGSNLSPGLYMIKIQNQSGSSFAKILKDF